MHTPKHEFVRKPRKILSKDKNIHIGEHSAMNKQKSKDTQQKKIAFQISPNKPYNLISNLRFQLINLRQQVSKLSKKQNKQSNQQNQLKLQYGTRSPKQKKDINSYYFQSKKHSVLSNDRQNSRSKVKTFTQAEAISVQNKKKNDQKQQMKLKIQDFERRNELLAKNNEDLNAKIKQMAEMFKQEYQTKISQIQMQRQRQVKPKYQHQNDITINYHKQALQKQELLQNLTKKIELIQSQNFKLKIQIDKYKKLQNLLQQKQAQLLQKQNFIQKLRISIQELKQQKQITIKQKQQHLYEIKKLNNSIIEQMDIFSKNKQRIQCLQNANKQLQKNNQLYLKNISQLKLKQNKVNNQNGNINQFQTRFKNKNEVQGRKKGKSSKMQVKGEGKELYEIIQLQEKSIMNQQSDINYLQSQLRKLSFLKIVNKNQNDTIEGLNQQIVNTHLDNLNKKYKVLYK